MLSFPFNVLRLNTFDSWCRKLTGYKGSFFVVCIAMAGSNGFSVSVGQEDRTDAIKQQAFIVKLEKPSFSTVHATIDIGSIERGKTTIIPLRFENNLGADVTFKTVVVSCACTGAKIPDENMKVGQALSGEVGLTVAKGERSLSKVFSLEIKTTGFVDRVLIDLKADISNVVAFNQELYTVSIDTNRLQEKKKITLSLPLIASSGMNLDELCVSSSGALFEKARNSITTEYKAIPESSSMKGLVGNVIVEIDPGAIVSDSEYLSVHIDGRYFDRETTQIVVRKKQPVSLIPETLYFSSTDLENIQAFGLIRLSGDLDASSLKLVSAKLDSGEVLESVLKVSGNKTARLDITCSKEEASKWKKSTRELKIVLECDGRQIPVNSRCHFQW